MIDSWEPMTSTSSLAVTISGGITKPRAQPIYIHHVNIHWLSLSQGGSQSPEHSRSTYTTWIFIVCHYLRGDHKAQSTADLHTPREYSLVTHVNIHCLSLSQGGSQSREHSRSGSQSPEHSRSTYTTWIFISHTREYSLAVTISGGITKPRAQPIYIHPVNIH